MLTQILEAEKFRFILKFKLKLDFIDLFSVVRTRVHVRMYLQSEIIWFTNEKRLGNVPAIDGIVIWAHKLKVSAVVAPE